jgi:anti-sigma factor RsiW
MSDANSECSRLDLLIQADVDGELDVTEAAKIAAHIACCERCARLHARLRELKSSVRTRSSYHRPTADFEKSLLRSLDKNSFKVVGFDGARRRTWWLSAWSAIAGAVATAMILLVTHRPTTAIPDEIVASHVRSLQPNHLIDVISADTHTVKPWFEGKLDFAPPVKNLAADGFPLEGGRLDYIGQRTIAALVYRYGKHPINMFVWPASHADSSVSMRETSRNGFRIYHWTQGAMEIWVVADVNDQSMRDFIRKWQSAP